ncbi:MAG TPA: glycosyltransferase family 2 protein [Candidatus Saccharimonadales bacterium]|nr:glycosyltransferase family 2 protein [Candidatus Saccharimonadales bacterium]
MDSTISPNSVPKVSIVIPARNEEANLERCLRSLVVQEGIPFEVIIVNDDSKDRTRSIAESFTRVRQCPFIALNQFLIDVHVIDARQPLPEGWTGKANALVAGEAAASGEWLLFTDADTEHLEGSLAASITEAEEHRADLLSYSPGQVLTGIRQQLLMPLIFCELAMKYSPRRVSDPALPDAAANGQYLLVRSAAHRRIGGFASVATELLDDVALARRYKQQQCKIRFRYAGEAVRTRMYSSWDDLRVGWTKNLAILFPNARELAKKRSGEFTRLFLSLAIAIFWTVFYFTRSDIAGDWFWPVMIGIFWLFTLMNFGLFYARVARAHFSLGNTLASIFGLRLFAGLLRCSADAHEKGTVTWRGRAYSTAGVAGRSIASNSK